MFSGRFFREILLELQEPFGEVSQSFSMENIWEEEGERGWKGGRGCGGGEEAEEKLKSAIRKNKFCDHIVFLQKPVFGEM